MGFNDDIKVLDTIIGKDGVAKVKTIKYPGVQKVTILTVHFQRALVPRKLSLTSGATIRTLIKVKDEFTSNFKRKLLKDSVKAVGVCEHCIISAWAYVRVMESRTVRCILKESPKELQV